MAARSTQRATHVRLPDIPGKHRTRVDAHLLTILVVEDEPALRSLMVSFLESEGFRVEAAGDGIEALEILGRVRPALMLLDLMMPRMDGAELITTLRKRTPAWNIPPIVMLSAVPQLAQTATRLGVDYLAKPFDLEVLLDKIMHHTSGRVLASVRV
jgi:DNA-binding response OmpR family regulator